MPVLPLLRLTAGLHTGPLEASADHCVDSVNVFSSNGRLVKRSGSVPVRAITGLGAVPYVGWGVGSTEPTTVSNSSNQAATTTAYTLYVGHSSAFNRAAVYGTCATHTVLSDSETNFVGLNEFTYEYWNGTAWTAVDAGSMFKPSRHTVSAASAYLLSPFYMYRASSSATSSAIKQLDIVLSPPSDWAAKTINGQSKYWLRISGWPSTHYYSSMTVVPASSTVNAVENRILHINVFRDRRGKRHTFIAYLFGQDGRELRFELDGVVLSQSAGLQPDGDASTATGSRQFSARTRVTSHYHAATNRVIGNVEGHGWFFFLASTITSSSSGEIYNLTADQAGTDTPYQSVLGGLRSTIPSSSINTLYDGRIFVCVGQMIYWSAPGVYADIWPRENEVLLADAGGNITGLAAVGGVLVVFKRNSIWVGQSDGSADGYTFYPIPGNVGCVAPRSIAVAGNVAYFLAEDGVYSFDGQMVSKVSAAIDGFLNGPEFTANAEDAIGVYASAHDQYRLYYRSTASSSVLDAALYCDLYGHTTRVEGREVQVVSWWRQGKYATTDYGFQATAVAADNTTDTNRVLIGDRYGVVWEADRGRYDAGSAVQGYLLSHRIGLGSSRKALVRWLAASQKNVGNYGWTLGVYAEGRKDEEQENTVNPYSAADSSVFTAAGTFTVSGTFAYSQDQSVVPNSVQVLGRWFQLELLEPNAAPWECDGIEVEVNTFGRRQ